MNENDEYSHVQRRLCAVIAKSEWTSSRMRMQKSGEELRERRAKSHRTANQFLQDLLEKRTDSDLIDDNGAVDRYHNFVKFKSAFHDDTNTTLDEFDRRLRDLNSNRPTSARKLTDQQHFNPILPQKPSPIKHDLPPADEPHNDDERSKLSRILPSISIIPTTSTPNDTTDELTTSTFHVDDIHELSDVHSPTTSFIDSSIYPIESSHHQHHHQHSSLLDKFETLNSSTSSSTHLKTQTLHVPKARRADGSEAFHSSSSSSSLSSRSPLPGVSSHTTLFNHSYLPRSLTLRAKLSTHSASKRQLPILPTNQSSEQQPTVQEQFHPDQLYELLDNLDDPSCDGHFTDKLQQLTPSMVISNHPESTPNNTSLENVSLLDEHEENTFPHLFNHSLSSAQEKQFYTTSQVSVNDIKDLSLYTMTLSTVQLSASLLFPYSILNGRRPLLKCSSQTCFTPVRSKHTTNICRVTAIEGSLDQAQLQANDILLEVQDRSVWGLTTDEINDLLEQCHRRSNTCSLTIARLCRPLI